MVVVIVVVVAVVVYFQASSARQFECKLWIFWCLLLVATFQSLSTGSWISFFSTVVADIVSALRGLCEMWFLCYLTVDLLPGQKPSMSYVCLSRWWIVYFVLSITGQTQSRNQFGAQWPDGPKSLATGFVYSSVAGFGGSGGVRVSSSSVAA